ATAARAVGSDARAGRVGAPVAAARVDGDIAHASGRKQESRTTRAAAAATVVLNGVVGCRAAYVYGTRAGEGGGTHDNNDTPTGRTAGGKTVTRCTGTVVAVAGTTAAAHHERRGGRAGKDGAPDTTANGGGVPPKATCAARAAV